MAVLDLEKDRDFCPRSSRERRDSRTLNYIRKEGALKSLNKAITAYE
jgi:hypothetical protein